MKQSARVIPALLLAALASVPRISVAVPADERPEADLDRSTATLAATLALDKLAKSVAREEPSDAALLAEMSANPGRYRDPGEARRELQGFFAASFSARYADEAAKMLERLGGGLDDAFASSATNAPAALVDDYVSRNYDGVFKSARKKACREQAARISSKVRPSEKEVDELPEDELAKTMTSRVADSQSEPVFQENEKYIATSIVKPMLEEAYNERSFQNAIARECVPTGFAPSAIATNILVRVNEAVAARAAMKPEGAYGLFPSVAARTVPECAEARAGVILSRALDEEKVPFDNDAVALAIARDAAAHRKFADSRKAFLPGLADAMIASATKRELAAAPEGERAELEVFARGHFADKAIADKLSRRVEGELDAGLKRLRDAYAAIQLERLFPYMAKWNPDEALIDKVAESNDFRKALSRWRELGELKEFARIEAANPLLEETSALLDKTIVERAETGVGAMTEQHKMVDALFPDVRSHFAKEQRPALSKVVEHYSKIVAAAWEAKRKRTYSAEAYEAGLYAKLFPSTMRRIEMASKALMEAQAEAEETPEEPPPEEPPPPPPPEELEEIEMDFRIVFSLERDEIVADISTHGSTAGRYSCPYQRSGYRKHGTEFTASCAEAIKSVLGEAAKRNRIALTITVEVRDPFIYHGTVADSSRLVKAVVEDLGEYITKFDFNAPE